MSSEEPPGLNPASADRGCKTGFLGARAARPDSSAAGEKGCRNRHGFAATTRAAASRETEIVTWPDASPTHRVEEKVRGRVCQLHRIAPSERIDSGARRASAPNWVRVRTTGHRHRGHFSAAIGTEAPEGSSVPVSSQDNREGRTSRDDAITKRINHYSAGRTDELVDGRGPAREYQGEHKRVLGLHRRRELSPQISVGGAFVQW